jgi:hypothetical protein
MIVWLVVFNHHVTSLGVPVYWQIFTVYNAVKLIEPLEQVIWITHFITATGYLDNIRANISKF